MKLIVALLLSTLTVTARAYAILLLWKTASDPFNLPVVTIWHVTAALLIFIAFTVKHDSGKKEASWKDVIVNIVTSLFISGYLATFAVIIKSNI